MPDNKEPPDSQILELTSFPVISLYKYNRLITLPGSIYKFKIPKKKFLKSIFQVYKSQPNFRKNLVLKKISIEGSSSNDDVSVISSSTMCNLLSFDHNYRIKGSNNKEELPLYMILIPNFLSPSIIDTTNNNASNANWFSGSVCEIVGCVIKDEDLVVSFKSIARSRVQINSALNFNDSLVHSDKTLIDIGAKNQNDENLKYLPGFLNDLHTIDLRITKFCANFKKSLNGKNHNDSLYLLSPLCNILYIDFTRPQFVKFWGLVLKYKDESYSKKNLSSVLEVIDLIITRLPTTQTQKYLMLQAFNINEKWATFHKIVGEDFVHTLQNIMDAVKYVETTYREKLTRLEKTRLIASQLKGLKICLDDVKGISHNAKPVRLVKFTTNSTNTSNNYNTRNPEKEEEENDDNDDNANDADNELHKFMKNVDRLGIHPDGIKLLQKDYRRLKRMNPQTAEYNQLRNYFDIIMDIPFGTNYYDSKVSGAKYELKFNLNKYKRQLDAAHYGLNQVKRRILEYLCIYQLTGNDKTSKHDETRPVILLLDGPPGVGKTSIGKSIANILGRKFQRISLGGIYNESEIRGHRRTYVGSMNGLIVNALRKSNCMNPVILLDEVDKVLSRKSGRGSSNVGSNGDPSAALLEVLDPEQNNSFIDHYVGFPIDLSQIVFICTSNDMHEIPAPLLDRMEVIELSGYTFDEKRNIGEKFLLPKQIKLNGLHRLNCKNGCTDNRAYVKLDCGSWEMLIYNYTREAGVRNLERKLATIVRYIIFQELVDNTQTSTKINKTVTITPKRLVQILGEPENINFLNQLVTKYDKNNGELLGVVNGLSYNNDGSGSVLVFEIVKTGENEGESGPTIFTTGNLGSILQESIDVGNSLIQSLLYNKSIPMEPFGSNYLNSKFHLHVPEGAISKDGPSAGMCITLGLLSHLLKKKVDRKICMTGEITLTGKILPIGGLKEKLYGASVNKMKIVMVPIDNKNDLKNLCRDNDWCAGTDILELQLIKKNLELDVFYISTIYDAIGIVWGKDIQIVTTGDNPIPKFTHIRPDSVTDNVSLL
ncbi:related to Lon protease homolog 2, peroxisomal [Saccharomycodes ludwigii]|uniref:endopeptidase La n=1 Tax=Saccharomycodes ludwigii TaxID=36035 RepID=A0A376B4K9_9ASCO|nr:related to Lon protease homolog 2, peroxisomal [Saccharomycodes ludwigii]